MHLTHVYTDIDTYIHVCIHMYMIYKDLSMNMYICMCVCMYVCMQPFNSIKHFQSQSKGNDGREKQLSWDKKKEITVTRAVSMMFQKERRLRENLEGGYNLDTKTENVGNG